MESKERTLWIEVAQEAPLAEDIEANIERVVSAVENTEATFVIFPELFLSGYDTDHLDTTMSDTVAFSLSDPRLDRLAEACAVRGRALIVGFAEHDGDAGVFDSALVIDTDGSRRVVRKSHLFGSEREVFLSGDTIAPVRLAGVNVGIINCFEIEFPEVGRALALQGAELLVVISANMAPYQTDHEIGTRARAIENRLPLAYANRIGSQDGHDFCGLSRIVGADGTVREQLDETTPGRILAQITLRDRPEREVDMLAQLRPELYS